jgi:hypothetical protein
MTDYRTRNQALVQYALLPTIFLTVALLGGFRVDAETRAFIFIAPPLIALVLAAMLLALFARGTLIALDRWFSFDFPARVNLSHGLTLLALFFATAQAFNSVLPERGLLRWMFSFFFLWTLWTNQFLSFDARRLLRSLAVLFGTAFFLKHMLVASLSAPAGGWLNRLARALLEGASFNLLDVPSFAPATGYVSFFTLALYVAGLALLSPAPKEEISIEGREPVRKRRQLTSADHALARRGVPENQRPETETLVVPQLNEAPTKIEAEALEDPTTTRDAKTHKRP